MSINDSSTANSPLIGMIQLSHGEGMALPAYESEGAAGMDLRAAVKDDQPVVIGPGERALLPTGLIMEIPHGFEGQIRPRSGLAARAGITCLNTPGTIDSDYRGEVRVLLVNLGQEPFSVTRGLRMAQLVVAPVIQARVELRSEAGETARGAGGFGSTGTG